MTHPTPGIQSKAGEIVVRQRAFERGIVFFNGGERGGVFPAEVDAEVLRGIELLEADNHETKQA